MTPVPWLLIQVVLGLGKENPRTETPLLDKLTGHEGRAIRPWFVSIVEERISILTLVNGVRERKRRRERERKDMKMGIDSLAWKEICIDEVKGCRIGLQGMGPSNTVLIVQFLRLL